MRAPQLEKRAQVRERLRSLNWMRRRVRVGGRNEAENGIALGDGVTLSWGTSGILGRHQVCQVPLWHALGNPGARGEAHLSANHG